MSAGNGQDDNKTDDFAPRFLELKRMMPALVRRGAAHPGIGHLVNAAPAFVLAFTSVQLPPGTIRTAVHAVRDGLAPLPCNPCLIEFVGVRRSPVFAIYFDAVNDSDWWVILPWFKNETGWHNIKFPILLQTSTLQYQLGGTAESDEPPDLDEEAEGYLRQVVESVMLGAYFVTHAGDASETREAGPTTRRLMQAKGLKGWQYRYAMITPEIIVRAQRSPQGGTHASPRWHTRRAHVRRLKSGKVVAVRSCEVGDPERGGIVKDYLLPEEPTLP